MRSGRYHVQSCRDSLLLERMLLQYLLVIVRSDIFDKKAPIICELAEKAIGEDIGISLRAPFSGVQEIKDEEDKGKSQGLYSGAEELAMKIIKKHGRSHASKVMRGALENLLTIRLGQIPKGADIKERRINRIAKIFGLSKVEKGILMFLYFVENSPMGHDYFQSQLGDFSKNEVLTNFGHKFFQCPRYEVQKALAPSGKLVHSTLIEMGPSLRFCISEWMDQYMSGFLRDNLALAFCTKHKGEGLPLELHHADKPSKSLMTELLARKGAVNILFYGEPGSGKSELVKSLADKTKKELFVLNHDSESQISALKGGLIAATKLISSESAILLVDEADVLLNTEMSFFRSGESNSKAWLNNFLDSSRHKIIWITNRSGQIDPSVLRRFTFSMEFKRMNIETKVAVFNNRLSKLRLDNYFTDQEIRNICRQYRINAGGIVDMLKTLKVRRNQDKQGVMAKLHLILKNHEAAIHRGEPAKAKMKEVSTYCIDSLNLSEKPQAIIDTLRNYLDQQAVTQNTVRSMNLLFYGKPGTGKTEFAKHLSATLDREIRLKRASDLMSKWVGESEKLIAEAFEDAAQDGAILFLDEADTFFYPRGMAQHSWEKSQTNELLTQMENYNGILICATNMREGLDDAALRRFKYKVEFKALTGEGVVAMYLAMLAALVVDPLTPYEMDALANMSGLTHGDFFVVSEKYSLRTNKTVHADLIASLRQELGHKQKTVPKIGFRIAG